MVVVAFPVVALVFSVAVFFVVDQQNRRASDAVERTLQVQNALEEVSGLVVDAETGGRGFLLTGDPEYLVPLDDAREAIPTALTRLRRLVDTDAVQQTRVDELETLIEERLAISEDTTGFGPDDLRSPALRSRLDAGKHATDEIRALVGLVASVEDAELADRQADADRAQRRGVLSVVAALAAGLVGAVAAAGLYSRGVSRRLGELREHAEQMARGEPPGSIPDGDDEIGILGRALRDARIELNDRAAMLADREASLRALLDATPDIILVFDTAGTVLSVNRAIHTVLGYDPESRVDRSAGDVIHPDDIDRFLDALGGVASGEQEELALRYRVRHALGHWVDVEARGRVVANNGDRHVLLVSRDIGAQVHLEAAQQQAREAAEQANRSKSEFLSSMSHELRTPLNAVMGFAQILELDDLDHEQREAVDHILKAGRHLLDLINEVLDIARIDAGSIALSPEPVHVGELVTEAVDLIRPLAANRSIEILDTPAAVCDHYVLADRQRAKQVLLNLLSNAVKYNRHGGTISVTCHHEPSRADVSVTDTGYGIRPDVRHLLFTPFERLDATQSDVEGTGIGLALSQRLAEAMGGTLELASSSGHGSTFVVRLPLVEGPDDRHDRLTPHSTRTAATAAGRPDVRHTIVHVEDNLSNLRLIERILAPRTDIDLIAAMQGRLAIELIGQHQPVLVLLDLHLPDLDGDEVLRQLVADPATASIPVIILSADATRGQVERLLGAGAYAYLTKPIDVRQLISTIDTIVDHRRDPDR